MLAQCLWACGSLDRHDRLVQRGAQVMAGLELETGGDVDALALAEVYTTLLAAGDTGERITN